MKLIALAFYVFFLMLFLAIAASPAHADTLDPSVQIVSGGAVNAQALATEVTARVKGAIGGEVLVTTEVVPSRGTSTITVKVIADNLQPANIWRVRLIIESAVRAPGVVRNGYHTRLQRTSRAFSLL